MHNLFSVITGDLIGFTSYKANERERALSELKSFLQNLNKDKALVKQHFEIIRGDGFQGAIKDMGQSLKIGLQIKCFLKTLPPLPESTSKALDARIAIGIGKIDFFKKNISESDGEAFWLAGRLLESMKKNQSGICIESNDKNFNAEMDAHCTSIDAIMSKWTTQQTELVFEKLQNKKETDIAKKLGISQAAVNHRSQKSSWHAIEKIIKRFEQIQNNPSPV